MQKFSVILHGAITPGDKAREALKVELCQKLSWPHEVVEEYFHALPTILEEDLDEDTAKRLADSLSALGADVELLSVSERPAPEDALAELRDEKSTPLSISFETEPETQFQNIDQPGTRTPHDPLADLNFELGPSDESSNIPPSSPAPSSPTTPQAAEPEKDSPFSGLSFEAIEPAPPRPTPTLEALERMTPSLSEGPPSKPPPLPQVESESSSEGNALESSAGELESYHPEAVPGLSEVSTPPPLPEEPTEAPSAPEASDTDWRSIKVEAPFRRPKEESHSKRKLIIAASATIVAAGFGFLNLALNNRSTSVVFDESAIDAILAQTERMKSAPPRRAPSPFTREPFTSFATGTSLSKNLSITVELGITAGKKTAQRIDLSLVSIKGTPPPAPSRQDFVKGYTPPPWLAEFTTAQKTARVSAPQVNKSAGTYSFRLEILGPMTIKTGNQSGRVAGRFWIDGEMTTDGEVKGLRWRLMNATVSEDKVPQDSGELVVKRLPDNSLFVWASGVIEKTVAVTPPSPEPTPTPIPVLE